MSYIVLEIQKCQYFKLNQVILNTLRRKSNSFFFMKMLLQFTNEQLTNRFGDFSSPGP